MAKRTQTKWRWFAAAAIPSTLVASGLMVGVANGAVPVAINVAGETFKVSADKLVGEDFVQYASVAAEDGDGVPDGNDTPVAASVIGRATLTNLCQSVLVPNPFGDPITLLISAGNAGEAAVANNMTIGLDNLQGDAKFDNIFIGKDGRGLADSVDDDPHNAGIAGTIGQRADTITVENLRQEAYSVHAGTFTLPNLNLEVNLEGKECY